MLFEQVKAGSEFTLPIKPTHGILSGGLGLKIKPRLMHSTESEVNAFFLTTEAKLYTTWVGEKTEVLPLFPMTMTITGE